MIFFYVSLILEILYLSSQKGHISWPSAKKLSEIGQNVQT